MDIMMYAPEMEFHISRQTRDRYRFSDSLFSTSGNIIFINYHSARIFVQKMNEKRDLLNFPEQAVKTGQIVSMGLIDEILHHVVFLYRQEINAQTMGKALSSLYDTMGKENVDRAVGAFIDEFPPLSVYRQELTTEAYLLGKTEEIPNIQIALEEMLLLWLANMNPAFSPFHELFDDSNLKRNTAYLEIITGIKNIFEKKPPFGPYSQALVEMLRSPAVTVPHSLSGQLEYIRQHWGFLLSRYLSKLLSGLDLIKEEQKVTFLGPGPAEVYKFKGLELEPEQFTLDREWMPKLILMAKNIYVWLDQLSKTYNRPITKLNEIPAKELETLQRQGFSGLWLIGLWERSPSSQKIKQLCGNPEAVPSAYSLFDYQIAEDLGGEDAYRDFRDTAWNHGIRLASDMVPNHVGIYSRWIVEHPDWFVSLNHNPFPWYTYGGTDLSTDERVGLFIEDHYYSRTDAAVVFKRVDRWTGSEQYIYHGNDGTSMPWNDTAQLNYLNPEMREAMIQTILHVARKFPVIRFDAAMTLTKRHFQRLWFPQPGTGGAIPTRAEFGMSKQEFDKAMPNEFWREVVDRLAVEAPDTLLLAEAFWLLEGYFVRTLGMHRVYNSAFMNMLRDEENAKYRVVLKNTLEFDPEVLRRFVNFMNNPDERTAVDQFGKDNKYFGVCTLMITLPGLPMFGHGQVEGYAEKYGMEYRRAYWDENPDKSLIERHDREIFPLLHQRHLFAGVDNFLLYDFFTTDGTVNEDVFAYSNSFGSEKSLVAYHNKNGNAAGWIRTSVTYSVKESGDGKRILIQKTLGVGLAIPPANKRFTVFRDHQSRLEYIRQNSDLCDRGLYIELGPYEYHVFLDFRDLEDNEHHHYARLTHYLNGRGVPSVDEALREIFLQPIHHCFSELSDTNFLRRLWDTRWAILHKELESPPKDLLSDIETKATNLLSEIKHHTSGEGDIEGQARKIASIIECLMTGFDLKANISYYDKEIFKRNIIDIEENLENDDMVFYTLCNWTFVHILGAIASDTERDARELSRSWIDEWFLGRFVIQTLTDLGFDREAASRAVTIIKLLTIHQDWYKDHKNTYDLISSLLHDNEVRDLLQINRHLDILWFNKEAFEGLLFWMILVTAVKTSCDISIIQKSREAIMEKAISLMAPLYEALENSQYQVEKLLELLKAYSSSQESE
jgi:glycosidase